jgi:hypothetical protein
MKRGLFSASSAHYTLSLRVIFAEGGYAGKLEAFVYLALIGHSAVFLISVEPSLKRKA